MFWLFNFLSDLTSQKNNFMISQKIIKLVGHVQIDLSSMIKCQIDQMSK
jgi:hypothetical protein